MNTTTSAIESPEQALSSAGRHWPSDTAQVECFVVRKYPERRFHSHRETDSMSAVLLSGSPSSEVYVIGIVNSVVREVPQKAHIWALIRPGSLVSGQICDSLPRESMSDWSAASDMIGSEILSLSYIPEFKSSSADIKTIANASPHQPLYMLSAAADAALSQALLRSGRFLD